MRLSGDDECCGALLGVISEVRMVKRVVELANMLGETAHYRYEIAGRDLLGLEKEAARDGLDIVGFYHSHPHGAPQPSDIDLQKAWPEYSYIIVGEDPNGRYAARCWMLSPEGGGFKEQQLRVTRGADEN